MDYCTLGYRKGSVVLAYQVGKQVLLVTRSAVVAVGKGCCTAGMDFALSSSSKEQQHHWEPGFERE